MGVNLFNQRYFIYNYASVFGGQERYLESLLLSLQSKNIACEFTGGPERLLRSLIGQKSQVKNEISVELLNGNKALYLQAWRKQKTDLRIYVQHSSVSDGQQSFIKCLIRKVLLRLLLTQVDIVIRVCNKALPDHYAAGKIHTIYNGVSLPAIPCVSHEKRPFTLLMVGAVTENKNQLFALRLLEHIDDIRLIIVGDGPKRVDWQHWADEHGLASRIEWTGFVEHPESYYTQADALLMLSRFEAFPYVVLEAMSYCLPVISVPVGGVPEAITHERDGLLLGSYDINELIHAVERLKNDPELSRQLGLEARKTIAERFTLDVMVNSLLNIINEKAREKGVSI